MSKAKFAAAKELIDEKDYAGARAILKSIDHPTARAWEAKLDEIAPPNFKKPTGALPYLLAIFGVFSLIGIVLVVLLIRSTGFNIGLNGVTCDTASWWNNVKPTVVEFIDTATTASSTSRMSLSSVIIQLNATYRKYDQIDHPNCVKDIDDRLDGAMSETIKGFNSFLGQDDIMTSVAFTIANQYFWDVKEKLTSKSVYSYDIRMLYTHTIWGGDEPTSAQATRFAAPPSTNTPSRVDTRPTLPPEQDLSGG